MPRWRRQTRRTRRRPRRRGFARRRTVRRRTFRRTTSTRNLRTLSSRQQVVVIKRTALEAFSMVPPATTGDSGSTQLVSVLSDLPDYTSFLAIWKQYKVRSINLIFRLSGWDSGAAVSPTLYVWKTVDTTLATASITLPVIQRISNVKQYNFSETKRTFSFKIRPFYLSMVWNGAATTGYVQSPTGKTGWVDGNYPNVYMYGFGMHFENMPAGTDNKISVDIEYEVAFKGMH